MVWGHTHKIACVFYESFSYRAVVTVAVLIAPVLPWPRHSAQSSSSPDHAVFCPGAASVSH
jgi:hypothetical protein